MHREDVLRKWCRRLVFVVAIGLLAVAANYIFRGLPTIIEKTLGTRLDAPRIVCVGDSITDGSHGHRRGGDGAGRGRGQEAFRSEAVNRACRTSALTSNGLGECQGRSRASG